MTQPSRFNLVLITGLLGLAMAPQLGLAIEPLDTQGHIFGLISDGTYEGTGVLESQSVWIPDARYTSSRTLRGGIIEARTTASVIGIEVATVQARLQVSPLDSQNFDLLDLDSLGADGKPGRAGGGSCELLSCSFEATVMGGRLSLKETWVPSEKSFEVVHGSQVYDGKPATYEGRFNLAH
jgi:hypothetical protein